MITRWMVKSKYVQKTLSSNKLIDFREGKEKFGNSGIISTPLTVVDCTLVKASNVGYK